MTNVLILEDNLEQSKFLQKIIEETYKTTSVYVANNIIQAVEFVQKYNFDLFVLDIVLDISDSLNDNGIDFASYIRKQTQYFHTPIIFITSYPEHMQSAINEAHCYSFIIKPYNRQEVIKTLLEVSDYGDHNSSFFRFKDYTGIVFKIRITDILYIESNGHRIIIHTEQCDYDTGELTLEKAKDVLPDTFIRCHRKYIVNMNKTCSYDRTNRFININNDIIPVGRAYKADFEEKWITF